MKVYIAFVSNYDCFSRNFWPLALYWSRDFTIVNHHDVLTIPFNIFMDNKNKIRRDKVLFTYSPTGNIISITLARGGINYYREDAIPLYILIEDIKFIKGDSRFLVKKSFHSEKRLRISESFVPPGYSEFEQSLGHSSSKYRYLPQGTRKPLSSTSNNQMRHERKNQ